MAVSNTLAPLCDGAREAWTVSAPPEIARKSHLSVSKLVIALLPASATWFPPQKGYIRICFADEDNETELVIDKYLLKLAPANNWWTVYGLQLRYVLDIAEHVRGDG